MLSSDQDDLGFSKRDRRSAAMLKLSRRRSKPFEGGRATEEEEDTWINAGDCQRKTRLCGTYRMRRIHWLRCQLQVLSVRGDDDDDADDANDADKRLV